MNTGRSSLGVLAIALTLLLSWTSAFAQGGDAYLDRYVLALGNLTRAVDALPTDAVLAREQVDQAFQALLTLSRDATSGALALALERVIERARTAITNASQDDLAVQAAVLTGGFQRLVYDAALRAAGEGNVALARSRLARLASDLGMPDTDRAAFARPDAPVAGLRFDLEAGVASVMERRLAAAREASTGGAAYRELAQAYGAFLLVQDSPRAAATLNQSFVEAAAALVSGDADAFGAVLVTLGRDVDALGAAARGRLASVVAPPAEAPSPTPSELPALVEDDPLRAPAEAAAAVVPEGAPAPVAATIATPVPVASVEPGDLEAVREELLAELRRGRLDLLEADLAAAGMSASARPPRAEALLDAGFERLDAAVERLSALAASVVAASHRGDATTVAARLRELSDHYDVHLSPVVRAAHTQVDLDTLVLLDHLRDAVGLRVVDTVVLAGHVEAVQGALGGAAPSAIQEGARRTTVVWAGLVRTIVLVVIALIALIPLFLLNLAFGGGNRNWQLIGVALFLLLVPALYEGIVAIGALLVTFAGLEFLTALAALSVFSSTVAQTMWVAVTLMAVVLATAGLYGICAQFGLVGRRTAPATARATRSGRTTNFETVDWDEDV